MSRGPLSDWVPPPYPKHLTLDGNFARLEPLSTTDHGPRLYAVYNADTSNTVWRYLPYGPFATQEEYITNLSNLSRTANTLIYAIIDKERNVPLGTISLMNIRPIHGCAEIGGVVYSLQMQRTRMATEAVYLLMKAAFDIGYRRVEWKCNSKNSKSVAAALRLGFSFEGVHRNAMVLKGHSRDNAWFSCVEEEWPPLREAFQTWLAPSNFDADGVQRVQLATLTRGVIKQRPPSSFL